MPAKHLGTANATERAVHSESGDIKERLLAERRDLIGALTVSSLNGHDSALSRRLRQIDEAVERISAGVYGVCEECGNQINEKRLARDPAAALCVSCQTLIELGVPLLKM